MYLLSIIGHTLYIISVFPNKNIIYKEMYNTMKFIDTSSFLLFFYSIILYVGFNAFNTIDECIFTCYLFINSARENLPRVKKFEKS